MYVKVKSFKNIRVHAETLNIETRILKSDLHQ